MYPPSSPETQPPRVALLNGYSTHNLGDALLVENAVRAIERLRPGARITVMAADAASFGARLEPHEVVPAPIGFPRDIRRLPWALVGLLTGGRLGDSRLRPLTEVDEAFSVGGGFLQFRRLREVITIGSVHVLQMAMCRRLAVPLTMLPQSVGPFGGRASTWLGRRVLRWFGAILVREHRSERYLQATAPEVAGRVTVTPDLAFLSDGHPIRPIEDHPRRVGVIVRQWWFPGHPEPDRAYAEYLESVASAMLALRRRGAEVDLLIQSNGPTHRGDDRIAARAVNERVNPPAPIVDLDAGEPANDAIARYGSYDLLVATRMHAALMGLLAGTPTIAIAYEWKTAGVFANLGLEDWVIDIADVTPERLGTLVERAATFPAEAASAAIRRERERLVEALASVEASPTRRRRPAPPDSASARRQP